MKREKAPTEVMIVLEQLNPYMIIMAKNVILTTNGQEDTAFRFVVDSEGVVTKVNELKKTLVKSKVGPL